jgi:hypothetical protein
LGIGRAHIASDSPRRPEVRVERELVHQVGG